MATCRVKRNDNGNITKVTNTDGTESTIYNNIARHPMISNEEEALDIFKNTLTSKLGDDPTFTHRVNGNIESEYKNVLKNSKEGDLIEIGFETSKGFQPIMTINKTTNRSTKEGFINNMIENNILNPSKKYTKDGYKFQAAGKSENAKIINSELIRDSAKAFLGVRGLKKDYTTFGLDKTNDKIRVIDHDGNFIDMTDEEISNMNYDQLKKVTPYALDYIMGREYSQNRPNYGFKKPENKLPNRSEEELQMILLNFLGKLGISTMSISQYVEKYNIKNGVDPSANALADIANKVIAFHEGEMGLEALTEEVAHFINEAMPQEEVQSILQDIHKSEEWNEYADTYREVYSKRYEGDALENAVRREVLGKVLANSILANFNTETQTSTQTGFMTRALDLLTKFFERVQAYFRPQYRTQLNSYLDSVQQILRADEVSNSLNTDNFEGNDLVLYSMNKIPKSSVKLSAEKAIMALRDQIQNSLSRAKKGSSVNKQQLKNIQDKLEENEEIGAIEDINSLSKTYITMLNEAVTDADKNDKSFVFTQEESIIHQAIKTQLVPSLNEIRSIIKERKDKKDWKAIDASLKETIDDFNTYSGRLSNIESKAVDNLIDKVMIRHELPETSRQYMSDWVKSAEADTNWFHSSFGMLTHSKDGLLNLAGNLQKDIATQSNIRWQESTKKYQQKLKELGFNESEVSQFIDGDFIVSEYDFNRFEEVLDRVEANLYKEVVESKDSIEDIIKAKKGGTREPMTSAQELELRRKLKDVRNPLLERKFKSSYYAEFENKLSNLGISQEGISYVMSYYGDMSQFKRAARREVGDRVIMDFSQLSEQDKALRNSIIKNRNNAKSYYNEKGDLKKGLEFDSNGEVVPSSTVKVSRDAQIAIDLNKLDDPANRTVELGSQSSDLPQVFLDTLREIDENEGKEAALEFLFMNSSIGFTQEYWDTVEVGSGRGLVPRLERYIEGNPVDIGAKQLLDDIKKDKDVLKSILKVYRNKNNPSEIDVDSMSLITRDTVKELQTRLTDNYKKVRPLVKDIEIEGEDSSIISGVNDAYTNKLEDLGISIDLSTDSSQDIRRKLSEELEFAYEHMTESDSIKVRNAVESIRLYNSGERHTVSTTVEQAFDNLGLELDSAINDETLVAVTQHISRSRVLPYYTRFAPEQYSSFMQELRESTDNLADTVPNATQRYNYMEVNPNYSFLDQDQNENINPDYVENFEGGYLQPKKNLNNSDIDYVVNNITDASEQKVVKDLLSSGFKSSKFTELFGTNPSGKLYEAYRATLDYNKESLQAMGVGDSYNLYTKPQVKQNRMERVSNLFGKGATLTQLREAFSEELTYTEDDKIQGEKSKFGDNIKIIPKMYVDRLDNPEDASNELFYSLALRAKESYLREARVEHYGDFMAIYDKIQNREYKGKGARPENTIKMFESAMDYSLFGIKETAMYPVETMFGTVDIAKLARNLLGFIKFRNLAFNAVIPITSYITGKVTREIEKYVGEHMDRRSQKLGSSEFRKHSREAISEIGQLNTESKLNVMGQYFGAFDLDESFKNSNYGFFLRNMPKVGMMLHTGANFPIYGSTLFGVLHDFRLVNGSLMRFNQFQRQKLSEGISKKDIKNEWNSLESEAIYNFMDVENGEMVFNDEAIRTKLLNSEGEVMSLEEYDEFKKEKVNTIRSHVSNVITNIDGQIPNESRVHAQRHFALNYFMTHRGWLSIVASRRFKNRHLNTETGELEEGSYRTLWNFTGRYIKQFKKGNFTDFVKNWKNVFDESAAADPQEAQLLRRNMKRIGIEMSILNSLMLIGFLLNGLADDDEYEENYGIQGLSYLFNRTLNEMSSAQVGSVNNFSEVIESPFVGWSTVKTFTDAGDLFSGDQVKNGTYRGLTERERFMTKLVPGAKQVYDLSSAKRVKKMRDTYMFYNSGNFNYTPLGNLYWLGKEDK